jgi:hypothetical protein
MSTRKSSRSSGCEHDGRERGEAVRAPRKEEGGELDGLAIRIFVIGTNQHEVVGKSTSGLKTWTATGLHGKDDESPLFFYLFLAVVYVASTTSMTRREGSGGGSCSKSKARPSKGHVYSTWEVSIFSRQYRQL